MSDSDWKGIRFSSPRCREAQAQNRAEREPERESSEATHLVLAHAGLAAAEPDFVAAELGGQVGDDLAHVQPLAGAVVALKLRRQRRLQNQAQLLAQLAGQRRGERLEAGPQRASPGRKFAVLQAQLAGALPRRQGLLRLATQGGHLVVSQHRHAGQGVCLLGVIQAGALQVE